MEDKFKGVSRDRTSSDKGRPGMKSPVIPKTNLSSDPREVQARKLRKEINNLNEQLKTSLEQEKNTAFILQIADIVLKNQTDHIQALWKLLKEAKPYIKRFKIPETENWLKNVSKIEKEIKEAEKTRRYKKK